LWGGKIGWRVGGRFGAWSPKQSPEPLTAAPRADAPSAKGLGAWPGQRQLSARHGTWRAPVGHGLVVGLDVWIGAQRGAQRAARMAGQLDRVPEPAVLVGVQHDAHRACALVEQSPNRATRARHSGDEPDHRFVARVEGVGRQQTHPHSRTKGAARHHSASCEHGEDEDDVTRSPRCTSTRSGTND
jgi:hypothetical protein